METEAQKRCSELQEQIDIIKENYYMTGDYTNRWNKEKEIKLLCDELKLLKQKI